MKIILFKRRMAISSPEKEVNIKGNFDNYYLGKDRINEELLLKNIPSDFLPVEPNRVSIMVEMEINPSAGRSLGSQGQDGLSVFQNHESDSVHRLQLCRDLVIKEEPQ